MWSKFLDLGIQINQYTYIYEESSMDKLRLLNTLVVCSGVDLEFELTSK